MNPPREGAAGRVSEGSNRDCRRATPIEIERNVTDVDFCLNVAPTPVTNVPVDVSPTPTRPSVTV